MSFGWRVKGLVRLWAVSFFALISVSTVKSTHNSAGKCVNPNISDCSNQTCFLLKNENPYVTLPPESNRSHSIFTERREFLCHEFRKHNIGGITFDLLESWLHREKNLGNNYKCYYAGDECTWNALVNYVTYNGGDSRERGNESLAVIGSLIEIPKRREIGTRHSIPYADDILTVVGLWEDVPSATLTTLIRPFHVSVWAMVAVQAILGFAVGVLLKYSNPWLPSRTRAPYQWVKFHCLDSCVQGLSTFIGGEDPANEQDATKKSPLSRLSPEKYQKTIPDPQYEFPGENISGNTEKEVYGFRPSSSNPAPSIPSGKQVHHSFKLGCYNIFRLFFTIAVAFFVGTTLILYEAALTTNFLFEGTTPALRQSLTNLTDNQLSQYAVLKESAIGDVFAALQRKNPNRKGKHDTPWVECDDFDSCFEQLRTRRVRYLVTTKLTTLFIIPQKSLCEVLTIYQAEQPLYSFNAGMIFGPNKTQELREQIDLELVRASISRRKERIFGKYLDQAKCSDSVSFITWSIYFPPLVIVSILIFIVIGVQFSMMIWSIWKSWNNPESSASIKKSYSKC